MKSLIVAIAVLLCALRVEAGALSGPNPVGTVLAAPTNTDFYIDVIPDTQNQTNPGTIAEGDGTTPSEDNCSTATDCVEPWCTHGKDCEKSWGDEGNKVLDAQVALVRGEDPQDPKRATGVLHLGDLADWFDTDGTKRRDNPCNLATLGAKTLGEWDNALEPHLLAPLRATGIPTVLAHGNHDANGCYEQRVVTPSSALPFFHGSAVDAVHLDASTVWAVKIATRVGKICALTAPFQFYAETRDAAKTLSGCGASLPTIAVKHQSVDEVGNATSPLFWSKSAAADDVVDRAGHAYIWLVVGGHETAGCAVGVCSFKGSYTGADSGAQIFTFQSNWQEAKRRNYSQAYPYGVTPPDGGDGEMTRIVVSPSRKFLHAYDYNPIRHGKGDYGINIKTSELYTSFDWCARFGGC